MNHKGMPWFFVAVLALTLAPIAHLSAQNGAKHGDRLGTQATKYSPGNARSNFTDAPGSKDLNNGATGKMDGSGAPSGTTNVGSGHVDAIANQIDTARSVRDSRVVPYAISAVVLAVASLAATFGIRSYRRRNHFTDSA